MLMKARGQARLESGKLRSKGVEAGHVEIRPIEVVVGYTTLVKQISRG